MANPVIHLNKVATPNIIASISFKLATHIMNKALTHYKP